MKLKTISIGEQSYHIEEVEGAKSGPDIRIHIPSCDNIGIEVKNKGAFEGGSAKMTYDQIQRRLVFPDDYPLHRACLGDIKVYSGMNLPFYEGKITLADYMPVSETFDKDIRIPIPSTTMSEYYKQGGVDYIQIQGYGLYHTGKDVLGLDVPFFECEQFLRIRTSKHKKKTDGGRFPSDVTGDINYNKKSLTKSPYDLDLRLPPRMKQVGE
jgi:hypothetical protein